MDKTLNQIRKYRSILIESLAVLDEIERTIESITVRPKRKMSSDLVLAYQKFHQVKVVLANMGVWRGGRPVKALPLDRECNTCHLTKPIHDFPWSSGQRVNRQFRCTTCKRAAMKSRYQRLAKTGLLESRKSTRLKQMTRLVTDAASGHGQ